MKYICALVVVENIKTARNFYEGLLGQSILADYGENVTYKGGFSVHQRRHFESLINATVTPRANNCELYFEDDDIDAVAAKLAAADIAFVHPLREQPWRQKVIRVYDPDQNIIEIGEPMPHVAYRLHQEGGSLADICRITYLSEDEVQKAIRSYTS